MIIAAAVMFGTVLTLLRVPAELTAWVTGAGLGKYGFLTAVCILLLVLGMFLENVAVILIVTPIVLPTLAAASISTSSGSAFSSSSFWRSRSLRRPSG